MIKMSKRPKLRPMRRRSRNTRLRWWLKRILLVVGFLFIGCTLGVVTVLYAYSQDLPTIGPLLEGYDPPQTTRILAKDGTVLGELFVERRTVVPLKRVPQVMVDAVIAAEDAEFRQHAGLDYPGMLRAVWSNLTSGRLSQGASTITQQVARTFFLTRQKKFSRKLKEILLTKRIEERLTKDEILFLYLNQINFGHARYGVGEAMHFYFDKPVEAITVEEAALLAGIPKGPSLYSPITHPEAALKRRAYVIGEMAKLKMIDAERAEQATQAPLGVVEHRGYDQQLAPEAVSRAIAELAGVIDRDTLRQGGFVIQTTIDPKLQRNARAAVRQGLQDIDKRHKRLAPFKTRQQWPKAKGGLDGRFLEGQTYRAIVVGHDDEAGLIRVRIGRRDGIIDLARASRYNPKKLKASAFALPKAALPVSLTRPPQKGKPLSLRIDAGPQAALVSINPEDGSISAMVGGETVNPGEFNRAVAAKRQPGSTFKAIVYLSAIHSGRYTAATLLDDAPEVQGEWQPQNTAEGSFEGTIRLRQAVARSMNMPAIKLITDLGPPAVVRVARQLGITSPMEPVPALALGTAEVSPLELAGAYTTIAAGGQFVEPWLVERVIAPDGVDLPLLGRSPKRVITDQEAYLITSLLESVVKEGTGARARSLGRAAAGKTGTSNDQRDAWFAGFTPDWVCVVWVGYDDFRSIGAKEYGSRAALPIWLKFMTVAHQGRIRRSFAPPEGIITAAIDPASGMRAYEGMAQAVDEVFIEGTEPVQTAIPPELVSPDSFLFEQAQTDAGPPEPLEHPAKENSSASI